MKIAIPKELTAGETRVAAVPETVSKLLKAEMSVQVETHAGALSFISDNDFQTAGALIKKNPAELFQDANVIFKVQRPIQIDDQQNELDHFQENSILIAPLDPIRNLDLVKKMNARKMTTFSLDMLPRIARAQSMDILSSMSNLAGYKSVIIAADYLTKIFPMLTTAAGTILPAKVIVIGAGVAGLQAIATARRLGGVVIAFDTRPIVAEQVKSLGAEFVSLETSHETAQDSSGYAKEQTAEYYKNEQDIISRYAKEADVIITTALVPGKRAPILITEEIVKAMQPGSVIVDLASEQGGNCTLTEAGKVVTKHHVTIVGILNLASTMPRHASMLYSRNLYSFLNYISPQLKNNQLDLTDEIIKGCLITYQGDIVHPIVKQAITKGQ